MDKRITAYELPKLSASFRYELKAIEKDLEEMEKRMEKTKKMIHVLQKRIIELEKLEKGVKDDDRRRDE